MHVHARPVVRYQVSYSLFTLNRYCLSSIIFIHSIGDINFIENIVINTLSVLSQTQMSMFEYYAFIAITNCVFPGEINAVRGNDTSTYLVYI